MDIAILRGIASYIPMNGRSHILIHSVCLMTYGTLYSIPMIFLFLSPPFPQTRYCILSIYGMHRNEISSTLHCFHVLTVCLYFTHTHSVHHKIIDDCSFLCVCHTYYVYLPLYYHVGVTSAPTKTRVVSSTSFLSARK